MDNENDSKNVSTGVVVPLDEYKELKEKIELLEIENMELKSKLGE